MKVEYCLPVEDVVFDFTTTPSAIDRAMQAANKPSEIPIRNMTTRFDCKVGVALTFLCQIKQIQKNIFMYHNNKSYSLYLFSL
jgi:hypothetical protein